MYILAILLPPVAVLMCGKPGQALLNLFLTLLLWVPGAIHAIMVVNAKKADERMEKHTNALINAQQTKTAE